MYTLYVHSGDCLACFLDLLVSLKKYLIKGFFVEMNSLTTQVYSKVYTNFPVKLKCVCYYYLVFKDQYKNNINLKDYSFKTKHKHKRYSYSYVRASTRVYTP